MVDWPIEIDTVLALSISIAHISTMDHYKLKQAFYLGDYATALEESSSLADETAVFYNAFSAILLSQSTQDLSTHGTLGKLLMAYEKFVSSKSKDTSSIKSLIENIETAKPFEIYVLVSVLIVSGDLDEAFELGNQFINSYSDNENLIGLFELLLLVIQASILNNHANIANKLFTSFTKNFNIHDTLSNENELIINLAESLIKFALNEDTTTSNFYYFDELSQTSPNWLTNLNLLNLQLQQLNDVEAQNIIDVLESEHYNTGTIPKYYKSNLLANKITLNLMKGETANIDELRKELKQVDPEHVYLKTHNELNAKFDEVVSKYSA